MIDKQLFNITGIDKSTSILNRLYDIIGAFKTANNKSSSSALNLYN